MKPRTEKDREIQRLQDKVRKLEDELEAIKERERRDLS